MTAAAATHPAHEVAAALRHLEDRARTWAKKFLHKVKAAATAAEARANGFASPSAPHLAPVRTPRDHSYTPSLTPQQSGLAPSTHSAGGDSSVARVESVQRDWRGTRAASDEAAPAEDASTWSSPLTDVESAHKKKTMFFNRLFSGRKS